MTLQEINRKWWYRLIKVLYVVAIIIVAGLGTLIVFSLNTEEVNYASSKVLCDNNVTLPLTQFTSNSTYYDLRALNHEQYLLPNVTIEKKIEDSCAFSKVMFQDGTEKMLPHDYINSMDLSNVAKIDEASLEYNKDGKPLVPFSFFMSGSDNYTIQIALKSHVIYLILISLAWLMFDIVCFEVLRRIFYYVVLGKLRPKKE